jgi:hypothetical protein
VHPKSSLFFLILASCTRARASSSSEEDVMKAVRRGSVARVFDSSVCFADVTSAPCLCPTSEPRLLCVNWTLDCDICRCAVPAIETSRTISHRTNHHCHSLCPLADGSETGSVLACMAL